MFARLRLVTHLLVDMLVDLDMLLVDQYVTGRYVIGWYVWFMFRLEWMCIVDLILFQEI